MIFALSVALCSALCAVVLAQQTNFPVVLNQTSTSSFLGQHNKLRALLRAGNMECMLSYSEKLAIAAQRAALNCSCNTHTDYPEGTAFYFSGVPGPLPSAEAIVQGFFDEGTNFYDYDTNNCELEQTCDNFKQFAWFEAKEVGCAVAKCESVFGPCAGFNTGSPGFLAACSYTYKALKNQNPYMVAKDGRTCSSCSSEMSFCSQDLCCSVDLLGGGGGAGGGFCGGLPGTEQLVYLSRMFYNRYRSNILVTNEELVKELLKIEGMQFIKNIGAVVRDDDKSVCPYLEPIRHLWDGGRKKDYFTVYKTTQLRNMGGRWEDKGVIGYAVAGPHLCGASLPIYEFYSQPYDCVVQLENGTDSEKLFKNQFQGDYKFVSISFYVWEAEDITAFR